MKKPSYENKKVSFGLKYSRMDEVRFVVATL